MKIALTAAAAILVAALAPRGDAHDLNEVRKATKRFRDVRVALAAGYGRQRTAWPDATVGWGFTTPTRS